ncbi:resuscitation-promoting factor Rpf2 [Arthrobacter sp. Hiyo4]|nr:resuscitation-promoting factor Rpf2 [Arthrobacter sp. Hiyo4]
MDLKLRAIVVKLFTTDGKFSFIKVGTQLVVLCALMLGLVAFVGNNKTVTLNVDGKVTSVQSFGGTVGQVVKSANVELKPADRVSPSADAKVENGTVINVNMAKAVKVSLDGSEKTINTTAPDVAGLVTELGVASSSSVSVPKDAQLAVAGSFVSISTPKTVSIVADGRASTATTTAGTVAQVLEDAGITLGVDDRTSQPGNAHVVNNMVVKVSRVDTSQTAATTEDVAFDSLTTESAELFKGEKEVTQAGVAGKVDKSFKLVMVDGREASRTLVSETVSVQPVTEKVTVGTKAKPAAAAGTNTGASARP